MEKKNLELRMYGFVPYNISGIQAGIQNGHGNDAFPIKFKDNELYSDWLYNWKTVIILNGGTTNRTIGRLGTMEQWEQRLHERGIKHATFHEPDLNDATTSVCFIVDERVFNRDDYPDFKFSIDHNPYNFKTDTFDFQFVDDNERLEFVKWVESIGGDANLWLRYFLKRFDLARN